MDGPPLELEVDERGAGERLDRFLRRALSGVSSGSVRRLIERKLVLVDGRPGRKGQELRLEQRVLVAVAARDERPLPQPELPLSILALTPAVVVVDKPSGMPSHPLLPGEKDTVANALLARHPECANASDNAREGGLVHRLDWSTSGVLLAARSRSVYRRLRSLFSAGEVRKRYLALVTGELREACHVALPLQTRPRDRRRVSVARRADIGLEASSDVRPLAVLTGSRSEGGAAADGTRTIVEVRCHTGRRHQVRIHLAAIGHPLVGDELYGGSPLGGLDGPLLHAERIELGGEVFRAPLPQARSALLAKLGWHGEDEAAVEEAAADDRGR